VVNELDIGRIVQENPSLILGGNNFWSGFTGTLFPRNRRVNTKKYMYIKITCSPYSLKYMKFVSKVYENLSW
jgi:hypothetical protein